jgi:hypothetical protein
MADFTSKYNTKLTAAEEVAFNTWARSTGKLRDLYDYDMRGAWKDGVSAAGNGHFPDTYKKPNHPTFSNQSKYHGVDGYKGGAWADDGSQYTASPTNLQFYPPQALTGYFKQVEPKARLVMPSAGTAGALGYNPNGD